MSKSIRMKISHIIWLLLLIILSILAVSISVIQGNKLMANNVKKVNYYLPKDTRAENINNYGSTKYYPKRDTIIFSAKPKIAKDINHTKVGTKAPIKYNEGIKHISKKLKKQTGIQSFRMTLQANHKRYIIEEK